MLKLSICGSFMFAKNWIFKSQIIKIYWVLKLQIHIAMFTEGLLTKTFF